MSKLSVLKRTARRQGALKRRTADVEKWAKAGNHDKLALAEVEVGILRKRVGGPGNPYGDK